MSNVIEFKGKPIRNLYMVGNRFITLATSPEEALSHEPYGDEVNETTIATLIDDQKEFHVIWHGKNIEIVLWDRKPKGLERFSRMLMVRDFIDNDLKWHGIPFCIDVIGDDVKLPKK